jgi:integrase
VSIRNPVTNLLFEYNGSLKGITTKEAAEEIVHTWRAKWLSGEPTSQNQTAEITIEDAIKRYLAEKRAASPSLSASRNGEVLKPLVPFMAEKGIQILQGVKTEHLTEFQQTWKGLCVRDTKTGEKIQLPKSQRGRALYQQYVKMFFKRARLLDWISANPADRLEPIRTEDPEIKVFTPTEKKSILEAIPKVFPESAAMVRAFVLAQRFSALRISDVVALETATLTGDGVLVRAQRKTDAPVYCALPPFVVDALLSFPPKSERYLFWTGKRTISDWV